jgi:hypothetical protein
LMPNAAHILTGLQTVDDDDGIVAVDRDAVEDDEEDEDAVENEAVEKGFAVWREAEENDEEDAAVENETEEREQKQRVG